MVSNIIKKANQSSDTQLIRNLNTAVATDLALTGETKYDTAHEAFEAADEAGYDVAKIVAKSEYNIAYELSKGRFVLLDTTSNTYLFPVDASNNETGTITNKADYFVVCSTEADAKGYSVYVGPNWSATDTDAEIDGVGFDTGDNTTITTVNYTNSGSAQDVVIRTDSDITKLSITVHEEGTVGSSDYKCDNVKVYGLTGELNVINGGQASVHTYGNVGFATVTLGKLVAEEGKVQAAYIPDSSATVAVNENGGEVAVVYVKVEGDKTTVVNNNKTNVEANEVVYLFDADHVSEASDASKVAAAVEAKAEEASLNAGNDVALTENPNAVARIGFETFTSLSDIVNYVNMESNLNKSIEVTILKDCYIQSSLHFEMVQLNLTINGCGHTVTNNGEWKADGSEAGKTLRVFMFGSADYEKYRPIVVVNNVNVVSQLECFYANDTVDVTLNNCNGTTSLTADQRKVTDGKTSLTNSFMETVLSASYDAKLIVNGGTFTSSNYGAGIYSTGGEIDLNNVTLTGAEYAYYIYAPKSSESVGNSTLKINNCTLTGKKFVSSEAGYNGYKAEVIGD